MPLSPRTKICSSVPFLAMALSLSATSLRDTFVSPMNTSPLALTEIVNGSLLLSSCLPLACGSSIGTPTVNSGAATMKMISSTSITSTMGVTLISCMGAWRWPRRLLRRPPPAACLRLIAIGSAPDVDLARDDGREPVRQGLEPLVDLLRIGGELIVEDHRRNGCNEAEGGGEEGYGNARGHDREAGVLRHRDRLEPGHDAPYGAEQADERRRRADGGEKQEAAVEALHLAADGHVHDLLDAQLDAA